MHKDSSSSSDEETDEAETKRGEIIIERDYSQTVRTQFDTTFPSRLRHRVSEEEFTHTIRTINALFMEAESNYQKQLDRLDDFLDSENNAIYKKHGLVWLNPLYNGLLYIKILDEQEYKND